METIATMNPDAASTIIQPVRVKGEDVDVVYRCRDPLTSHSGSIPRASTAHRAYRASKSERREPYRGARVLGPSSGPLPATLDETPRGRDE